MDNIGNELVGPVRTFLDREFDLERRIAMLESEGEDSKLWDEVAELGWFALAAPEEADGLGMDPSHLAALFRIFGERLMTGALLEQMLLPGLVLSAVGSHADNDSLASRMRSAITGATRITLADPAVTLHWSDVYGSVTLRSDCLEGTLETVRFGSQTDELLVIAQDTDGEVLILVDSGRSGVSVTPRSSSDPGSSFARVRFDNVNITDSDIVLRGQQAAGSISRVRSWQRLLLSCELAGIARHMLDVTLEFIQQREQFGRTIATFQAVRHVAATAAQRTIQLEDFCDALADDATTLTDEEFELAALTLKATASESARLVCEEALQLHGGIGFTYEYELHWYYKRALALRTWYGDERELAAEIGRRKLLVRTAKQG